MADQNTSAPGAILVTIGVLMFAFVFIANALAIPTNPVLRLLEEFLFLPIILILAGRAMQRRARTGAKPEPEQVRRPTTQQKRTQQHRASQQQQPAPQVSPAPERAPRTEPDRTLEEIMRGESDAVPIPPPRAPDQSPSTAALRRGTDLAGSRTSQTYRESFPAKTSKEMIADAKRRLRRDT